MATVEGPIREVDVPFSGGEYGGGRITGVGDLHLPPTKHSLTVHKNQAHYGPMSGGGETPGDKGAQEVVGAGGPGLGGDADGGSVCGTGGEGGKGGQERYGYRHLYGRIMQKK